MKKIVVVSTNNNPDYMFYAPYQEKAWNSYGWELCVLTTCDVNEADLKLKHSQVIKFPDIPELRKETIAQTSRLYAHHYLQDSLIMTCDMDLLPLQNYWTPHEDVVTVYGHDLTWFKFYPMGYAAMKTEIWNRFFGIQSSIEKQMVADAKEIGLAMSEDWENWWNHDWTLLTKRLGVIKDAITFINRGQINIAGATLALGRIDRYNWIETQKQSNWIDMHCETNNVFHPDKLEKFLAVFNKVHGEL